MTVERIFRIIGLIVFGIIGWTAGLFWYNAATGLDVNSLTVASAKYILPLTVVGAAIGALAAPWLTTRPAAWVVRIIRELTAVQLLAGGLGLVLGLVIARWLPCPCRISLRRFAPYCRPSSPSSSAIWASWSWSCVRRISSPCSAGEQGTCPARARRPRETGRSPRKCCCWTPASSSMAALPTWPRPASSARRCWCRALCWPSCSTSPIPPMRCAATGAGVGWRC